MSDGVVKTDNDDAIRRLLGWGKLDKAALFLLKMKRTTRCGLFLNNGLGSLASCRCADASGSKTFPKTNCSRDF